jgi:tripartite-type tricarboxylate transporter receptor subunit TctC
VPFAANGNTDGIIRLAGQRSSEKLGQPFVIPYIGGASGTIAATTVARAPAVGYTLLMAATSQVAMAGEKRALQVPDAPTAAKTGIRGTSALFGKGLMAPTNTPKPLIVRIAGEIALPAKDPTFVERLSSFGVDPLGNTPEQFAALIPSALKLWADAVAIAGIT